MPAVRRAARPTTISMTWRGRGRPRRRPGSTGPSPPCAASTRSWGSDGGTARHVRLLGVPPRPRRAPVPATAAGPHRRDADRPRRAGRRLSGALPAQAERGGAAAIPGLAPPEVVPVDAETAERYGAIVHALRTAGTPIPTNDLWIRLGHAAWAPRPHDRRPLQPRRADPGGVLWGRVTPGDSNGDAQGI